MLTATGIQGQSSYQVPAKAVKLISIPGRLLLAFRPLILLMFILFCGIGVM
jgi:hypothetical protein